MAAPTFGVPDGAPDLHMDTGRRVSSRRSFPTLPSLSTWAMLAVLAVPVAGLSLFAAAALCDLIPFIGVILRGF
ncbi:MAG: hypothetical protein PW843_26565 [Azospirillaceae bacterium]|nr:hypothetical protein [Azospirillaceae bacterium]